jgi:hypothetical protein
VLPKGPIVRACWCIVRVEPWVYPCANNYGDEGFYSGEETKLTDEEYSESARTEEVQTEELQ